MWAIVIYVLTAYSAFAESGQFNQYRMTMTTTATQVLPLNPNRKYLLVLNKGATGIYFSLDNATTGTQGVYIPAGGNYEPFKAPVNLIFLRAESATNDIEIIEG